jgi:5-methylthioadenosine/S-adenosylhomocysteine deaminase
VAGGLLVASSPAPAALFLSPGTCSVVVDQGRIVDILPWAEAEARYSPAKVQTLGPAHALMPGLVNAHTHLALNLLRGVADDMPLAQWLTEQIWPTEARLVSPDFVKVGTRLAIAECIRSGVTCINDMYWFPTATAEVCGVGGC